MQRLDRPSSVSRRSFMAGGLVATWAATAVSAEPVPRRAQIAITLDLEMSREYPRRGMLEWDFEKGNLDDATKRYAVEAGRVAKDRGGVIHYFCVGRVLEQPDVEWLRELASQGHPIGNHTYDHVYLLAATPEELQFRFRRAPWLIEGRTVDQILRQNIEWTTKGLKNRCDIHVNGFRTPGGFQQGLDGRADLQRLLLEQGFTWCSSKYPRHPTGPPKQPPTVEIYDEIVRSQADAQPFAYPSGLVEVPMSPISDVNAFRVNYWKLEWFLEAIRRGVEWAIAERAVFDFLAHPSCLVVEDPGFESIKLICDLVKASEGRAEIVGLDRIASRFLK